MSLHLSSLFFFNDTATTEIYTLSLHDALPISRGGGPTRCASARRRFMPHPTEPGRVAGVILAAGASRRMRANKMLLELEGEAVVRRAARRALAAGLSPVVVVLGHEPDQVRAALAGLVCEFVVNADFAGPTSGSLHKGLEGLPADVDAAVVMLADMVLVTEQMLGDEH